MCFLFRFTWYCIQICLFENLTKLYVRKYLDESILNIALSSKSIFYEFIEDILPIFTSLDHLELYTKVQPLSINCDVIVVSVTNQLSECDGFGNQSIFYASLFQDESLHKLDVCLSHLFERCMLKLLCLFLHNESPGIECSIIVLGDVCSIKLYAGRVKECYSSFHLSKTQTLQSRDFPGEKHSTFLQRKKRNILESFNSQ